MHPGPDTDQYATAALLHTSPAEALRHLRHLVDANLITEHQIGRYRLHDPVGDQSREPVADADDRAAQDRLLHYYAHTAQRASLAIAHHPRPAPDDPAASPADGPIPVPAVADPDAARSWLRTELPNLDAAFAYTCAHSLDGHVIALAAGMAEILLEDGPWPRALEVHQAAAEAAERLNRPAAHADALTDLGHVRSLTGNHRGAADAYGRALATYRPLGRSLGEATALTSLGRVRSLTGDFVGADSCLTRALEIYRALGHRHGEATALTDLGQTRYLIGDLRGAGDALTRALMLFCDH